MNILILTDYFFPSEAVAVRRFLAWVKYWRMSGAQISVVSSQGVIELPDTIDQSGVLLYCLDKTNTRSSVDRNVLKTHRFLKRNLFGSLLEPRVLKTKSFYNLAIQALKDRAIDVVVSSYPSFVPHLVAHNLKKIFPNILWFADFRDIWARSPVNPGSLISQFVELQVEKRILNDADAIVTVSQPLMDYLKSIHKQKVFLYSNGIDPDEFMLRKMTVVGKEQIRSNRIIFTGTIAKGVYDLQPLFDAVKEMFNLGLIVSEKDITIAFYGDHEAIDKKRLTRDGIVGFFEFIDRVPREEILKAQEQALGLLFFGSCANRGVVPEGILTGKLFEYLSSGTKIIAINTTPNDPVGKLLVKTRTGICVGSDVEKIVDVIQNLINDSKYVLDIQEEQLDSLMTDRISQLYFKKMQLFVEHRDVK
ncbi:MAG: glycosyltransferase involved in cell wall biosynthesis [Desulforhopalus sp.]|jgi:glycosyltransferase involved in cell wall biosynthesis